MRIGRIIFDRTEAGLLAFKNAGLSFAEICLNFTEDDERILKEGLLSYVGRIEKIGDEDMRDGLLHLVRGIECYVARCVSYLTSVSADERLVCALQRVPLHPARDAYEAIVAWNFVMYLDGCDNLGCLGRGLLPYYRGEDLIPYLENLYDNLDRNNG